MLLCVRGTWSAVPGCISELGIIMALPVSSAILLLGSEQNSQGYLSKFNRETCQASLVIIARAIRDKINGPRSAVQFSIVATGATYEGRSICILLRQTSGLEKTKILDRLLVGFTDCLSSEKKKP
ncbi:hypothetical protein VNO77_27854 [Canavalia gladiata]|uniref:Uncharacterized protein n=1 Tax=Canavalia gladiata TaxID=3824 RepID=A0AAN9Q4H1_CANGL